MKILNRSFIVLAALAAAVSAGCTLESPDAPPLTGPSTFGLAITVTASPDILPEDGASPSVIKIVVRDFNGQPVRDVALRVDTVSGDTIVDFGTLSAHNVTTNANGEATVVFTAPRAPHQGIDTGNTVDIRVTQIGTNFGSSLPMTVRIRLVPETVAQVAGAPTPIFTFSPASPAVGTEVFFDASASFDSNGGTIVRYQWTYNDGTIEDGRTQSHDFTAPGTYIVILTVTDNEGNASSVGKPITVSGS